MKSMLASMAVVLTLCAAPALSAEFPKSGEAEYDTYYVGNPVAKFDSGAGTGAIVDETGITRNVKGEGPFHDMSVRCLYHMSSVGETLHFNGSCVETDKDGDNEVVGKGQQPPVTSTSFRDSRSGCSTSSAAG